jgi:hypothetical protein
MTTPFICVDCNSTNIQWDVSHSNSVCCNCGRCYNNNVISNVDEYTFNVGDTFDNTKQYRYHRIVYFDTILKRLEGNIRTFVKEEVLSFLREELTLEKYDVLDYVKLSNDVQRVLNKSEFRKEKHKNKIIAAELLGIKPELPEQLRKDLHQLFYYTSYKADTSNKKKLCNMNMLIRQFLYILKSRNYSGVSSLDYLNMFPLPKVKSTKKKNAILIKKLFQEKNLFLNDEGNTKLTIPTYVDE